MDDRNNCRRVASLVRRYMLANSYSCGRLSREVGKSHTWISEILTGRTGAHLAVLRLRDRIEFGDELIAWAKQVREGKRQRSITASSTRAEVHSVRVYTIAAARWA